MTKTRKTPMVVWAQINWRKLERAVYKLQQRIYQASSRGDVKVVRKLQKTLLNSWSAKMLAIRQVRTEYQAQQLLIKLALEPEWEAKFESHSYGFRPGKTYMDPIMAIKEAMRYGSKYVISANLAQHFEQIDYEKLLSKINTFPKLRRQIRVGIKSGIYNLNSWLLNQEIIHPGSLLSPLLVNIALHGMEKIVREYGKTIPGKKEEITLIRHGSEFALLDSEFDVIIKAKILIEKFLSDLGIQINLEQTLNGFNFLDFNIRQYEIKTHSQPQRYQTFIQPSQEAIKTHYGELAQEIDKFKSCQSQLDLIKRLNPIITRWSNYYFPVNSAKTFQKLDHLMTLKLIAWVKARHNHKSTKQWVEKYFGSKDQANWVFRAFEESQPVYLTYHHGFLNAVKQCDTYTKTSTPNWYS
ncbi:reverse transcriptase N-terminal domain-containing protein [Cylindrospermopsis raciborskii]|uniref:reverse transcriptase N-terminal domain-containing protein n=1 Tax=Cylindrospermopsis raciborskii TaxID=77022 RepID=UPI0021556435|nr:reverse transcriptase N-terminal domain-containing protein [Cylindrospermopsis raciborskii]